MMAQQKTQEFDIYTDGACTGNPGPGGWGYVVILKDGTTIEKSGSSAQTTNNRMEMMAAIEALEALSDHTKINLYTDSKYLQQGITSWIIKWRQNNWLNAKREPVKNQDLWQRLDELCLKHDVSWHWVKGHSDNTYNNKADILARQAIIALQIS